MQSNLATGRQFSHRVRLGVSVDTMDYSPKLAPQSNHMPVVVINVGQWILP